MSSEFSALAMHDLDLHDVGTTAHVHFDLIKQINLGEKLHQLMHCALLRCDRDQTRGREGATPSKPFAIAD